MLALRLAWRNLLRNRRRTAITAMAVALNTVILFTTLALMEGMKSQMVRNATRLLTGDVQVHAEDYRRERSFYDAIAEPERLLEAIDERGIRAAPRSYGYGLVSRDSKSAGAQFVGMRPEAERRAFELADEMQQGRFLEDDTRGGVVLGSKLAKSLEAEVGAEVVAVVQAADGSLGNELYRVIGILKQVGEEIDRSAVLMHHRDFERLFVAGGRIHEIAVHGGGRDLEEVKNITAALAPRAEVATWRELMPAVADMVTLSDGALYLFAIIFFLAAGLGVLNTMLMATHDRVRELGVLKALGSSSWRILRDVATEALLLGVIATAAGSLVGIPIIYYLQTAGIDLRVFGDVSFGFAGIAWDPLWRAEVHLGDLVASLLSMWGAALAASLYPAAKAARLDPAQAMRHV